MEKENVGKGILFAVVGAVVGFIVWVALIAFLELGTGGVFGGILAAGLGMIIATAYQKGSGGKAGAVGFIVAILLSATGAVASIILGASFLIYNEGVGDSVFDAMGILWDLLRSEVIQDTSIAAGIAAVMAVVSLVGGNKKDTKVETEN